MCGIGPASPSAIPASQVEFYVGFPDAEQSERRAKLLRPLTCGREFSFTIGVVEQDDTVRRESFTHDWDESVSAAMRASWRPIADDQ